MKYKIISSTIYYWKKHSSIMKNDFFSNVVQISRIELESSGERDIRVEILSFETRPSGRLYDFFSRSYSNLNYWRFFIQRTNTFVSCSTYISTFQIFK